MPRRADHPAVTFERCPYDGSAISAEYSGGSLLLSCGTCRAAWEVHNTLVRRVTAPDWGRVRAAGGVEGRPPDPAGVRPHTDPA